MTQKEINAAIKEGIALKKAANKLIDDANLKTAEEIRLFKKSNEAYKKIIADLKDKNAELAEAKATQKEIVDTYIQQESKLKGLTGLQASLVDKDRARIQIMANAKNLDEEKRKTFQSIAELQNDLLNSSAEDVVTQAEINRKLDGHYKELENAQGIHRHIAKNLREQRDIASGISSLTEKQQTFLNKQLAVYEGIKDTIAGTLETASLLTSTFGGRMGLVLMAAGKVAGKIGEVNKQLGTTLFQSDGVGRKAGVLSFFFDDAAQNAKDLSAELGDTARASFEAQTNVGLMSMNMGISGTEAANLVGSFTRLNGNSTETAFNMAATSREFAKQNGIIPSQLMADLAGSAEEFALFGKQGGKNILEAAGYAAKLGVNMKTLSGISEGLLDFESSITKELELGAMLGKNINLNRARALAYEGDIEGATKETLKQLGGIEAFNRMDYFQKKQTADLLGVSVAELQKMGSNLENANTIGSAINKTFSAGGEMINAGLNKYLGTSLTSLGSMAMATAQMGGSFAQMGYDVKGLLGKLNPLKKFFNKSSTDSIVDNVKPDVKNVKTPQGDGGGGMIDKLKGIKPQQVLAGAAALVIVAGAVWVFGKAVQEFMKVNWNAVGMAVVSMAALVAAVVGIGMLMGTGVGAAAILAGAAAMVVAAAGVWVLGKALQEMAKVQGVDFSSIGGQILALSLSLLPLALMGPLLLLSAASLVVVGGALMVLGAGMQMVSTGFEGLSSVTTMINDMVSKTGDILLLSGSLYALAGSLAAVGTMGIISIPGLIALGAIGAAVSGINSLLGIESEDTGAVTDETVSDYQTQMINKMDELIQVTKSARDIYLDKDKVTNVIMDRSEKNSVNKFSLNSA